MWIHALTAYFLITRLAGTNMASTALLKGIGLTAMTLLSLLFFWHYAVKGNGAHVISSFEKQGNDAKYARVGVIMFTETLLLPLALSCLFILMNK
jgi:hypothetical protein